MRTAAFLAVALFVAGCSEPPEGEPGQQSDGEGTPWTTDLVLDSVGAPAGHATFTATKALERVTIAITIDEGAFVELRFTGPGDCASGIGSPHGSAIFLGATRVVLDGRFGNQPSSCGALPAGEHAIAWNLTRGTFQGKATLHALALNG